MARAEKSPRISVVMSAYNAADYLDEAITSILTQTFEDFEFIIIDDGSSDETNGIISDYARRDARVKLVTQKKNQGLIAALNLGFKLARGQYIARMDADDVSLPERFQREYDYLESHPDAVIVGTQAVFIDEKSKTTGFEPFLLDDEEIRTEIMIRNKQFRHGAVLIRHSLITRYGELYDPQAVHYEDFEYWPRLLRHGTCANLPEVLYLYRQSQTSLTATKKDEMRVGTDSVMERERAAASLPRFRTRQVIDAFHKATSYRPSRITVGGKHMRTGLRWLYQSYLFGLSKLYAGRGEYMSAAFVMAASFLLNPARYVMAIVDVTYHRVFPE